MVSAPLLAQVPDCPQSAVELRRVAEEAIRAPAARTVVPEGRTRVLHVYCAEVQKEPRRSAIISVVYNYSANVALRVTLDPASRQVLAGERMANQPQTSAEERVEAFRIVRETVAANAALEGGFVVPPPEGAGPGRFVQVQVLSPDRTKLVEFVTIELSRGVVAGRRRQ
jgi:hypothetical protein